MNLFESTITEKFNSMVTAVNMINKLIADDMRDINTYNMLDANYRHLEGMLAKSEIIADGRDLTPYRNAITAGREYTGIPAE